MTYKKLLHKCIPECCSI